MIQAKKALITALVIGSLSVGGAALALGPAEAPKEPGGEPMPRVHKHPGPLEEDLSPRGGDKEKRPLPPHEEKEKRDRKEKRPLPPEGGKEKRPKGEKEKRPLPPCGEKEKRPLPPCGEKENCPVPLCGEKEKRPAPRLDEKEKRPLPMHGEREVPPKPRDRFAMDLPREFQEKAVSLAKLRIDLQYTMERTPLDRAKAMELYGQIRKLEQEIATARFERKLDRIEAEAKRREDRQREEEGKRPDPRPEEEKLPEHWHEGVPHTAPGV